MKTTACPMCNTARVRKGNLLCNLCRRFNAYERPLMGGRWVRRGLVYHWVEDGAA